MKGRTSSSRVAVVKFTRQFISFKLSPDGGEAAEEDWQCVSVLIKEKGNEMADGQLSRVIVR